VPLQRQLAGVLGSLRDRREDSEYVFLGELPHVAAKAEDSFDAMHKSLRRFRPPHVGGVVGGCHRVERIKPRLYS